MAEFGIICPEAIISDGKFHHFVPENGKKKSGWYILHDYSYGAFGDFAKGIRQKWQYRSNLDMIFSDALEQEKLRQNSKLKLEVDNRQKHERASIKANQIFEKLSAKGESAYLDKKQVAGHGIRYGKGYIAIPLRDNKNKLWSLQFIYDNGSKRFLAGGLKSGCYHLLGTLEGEEHIIIAEGYATAASIYKATQKPTIVAFDAGNLDNVVVSIKKRFSHMQIVIAADDDCWN